MNEMTQREHAQLLVRSFAAATSAVGFIAAMAVTVSGAL